MRKNAMRYLQVAHMFIGLARIHANLAKMFALSYPMLAMECDMNYRDCLAEARINIIHAIKLRKEK